jgi:hypothetical protein
LHRALIYTARPNGEGRPKAGYMELVTAAAHEWKFPKVYMESLERWLPVTPAASGTRKFGDIEWT